ncbi:MAG: tRNA (adenosine(37)-N6)-threonylcarbamoyltransferase complex transferase subunit TsaD [Deltaproteobacteria bacterium]|nr:tRNA (adenosine(37)-N6)-threonylcarbamoyltransferase complex transferase subunit TsaD [Deltaproteobacteria bacterium]
MLCLGIESSCDETALALVRDGVLLGQTLKSQIDVHALFGGVVPELASREHGRLIGPLYDQLLAECGVSAEDIDCIAVTRGPGLLGSLLVGIAFAKSLSLALQKPVLGINHLHAHLLAAGLENDIPFPALGLLVSGGHTHIYHIASPLHFRLLGRSIDDAAGEAIDKFGKMLGLPYPAGKYIDLFSRGGEAVTHLFPRPYLDNDNCDFSFSGLKTAAYNLLEKRPELRFNSGMDAPVLPAGDVGRELSGLCASFQAAVAETLRLKLARALGQLRDKTREEGAPAPRVASLLLAGGVAANSAVRAGIRALAEKNGLPLLAPSAALCTDNAAMVAYAGLVLHQLGLCHDLSFPAVPRGEQVPDDYGRFLRYSES